MEIDKQLDKIAIAKQLWSDFKISGRPWKVAVIEAYAALFALREHDFLVEQVNLTAPTREAVELLNERIVDRICQKRLDSVLSSLIAAMTSAQKEGVAWTILVKLSHVYEPANKLAPDVEWKADGTGYCLKFPTYPEY